MFAERARQESVGYLLKICSMFAAAVLAGLGAFQVQAQTALTLPVNPVSTFTVSANQGTLGNCGSISNQVKGSFSAAVNSLKAYTVGCSASTTFNGDTCTGADPFINATGSCGFGYHSADGVVCTWFGFNYAPTTTKGTTVQQCTDAEILYWMGRPEALPQTCPVSGFVSQVTFEARNVTESPRHAEIWRITTGDGSPACNPGAQKWHTADVITSITGEFVGGTVSWSHSCAGTGRSFDPKTGKCALATDVNLAKSNDEPKGACSACTNPINVGSGAKIAQEIDFKGAGLFPLSLERRYSSALERPSTLGRSWRHSYDVKVVTVVANQSVRVQRSDGREFVFTLSAGTWVSDSDVSGRLVVQGAGWKYTADSSDGRGPDTVEVFDSAGRLLSITNRTGISQQLTYSTVGTPASVAPFPGFLISVSDPFGRQLNFSYDSVGRLKKVTDPSGGTIQYAYDAGEQLASVTYQDGTIRTYQYNEAANTGGANLPTALTGITDENGARFATWQYDSAGRATRSEHAGGASRVTIVYNANSTSSVTDSLGHTETFGFGSVLSVVRNTAVSGPCAGCGGTPVTTYGTNGNVSSRTDFNGNRTNYTYELARNLQTQRVEGLTAAGATTPLTRTINTQWHATFRLPTKVAEPLRVTTLVYNGDGGVTCGAVAALCSKTVQATTDASGAAGFAAVPLGTPRTWSYTYDANGQVLTLNGPRTDVADTTTYTYYANNDADLGKRGNVATISNALGQTTSIAAYDANGQPLTIVDPNGLTTTLAYDARLRLASRTVGTEVTTYTYDNAGQLTKVTLPDNSFLSYTYDAAHRLTAVQDNLGNKIAYTLDLIGNRIQEQVFDPSNVLAQTRSRVYSSINRLFQELGASGQTTEFGYDTQGNVISVKDPLNRITANTYDALNRLKLMTDPASGVTQYAYNGLDALTSVTDPRSLATSYSVDGLGNLTQQVSPDTGTTANSYDAAGNLLTQTDAKSQVTTYAYDALNRVSSITFNDSSKQTYVYDLGTNAIGRLSSITESNPASVVTSILSYTYDQRGRVLTETRTVAGVPYVTAYAYDSAGRLSGVTYPSGRAITYGFDALGRVNQVSMTKDGQATVLAQNIQYHPFGGAKSWTLGNGQIYARSVDLDGRIASYSLGSANYTVGFDAASRITGIAQTGNPANTNAYGYDALDRLTSAVLPNNTLGYGYDAVGNRTTKTIGASTDSLTYSATSNRLATIVPAGSPPRTIAMDSNGSTTNDGINQFAYDVRGRMVQATTASGSTTYQVNALGQRIRKTDSNGDTIYVYDTSGKLIAESDPGGTPIREYVFLGDVPVAVIQ